METLSLLRALASLRGSRTRVQNGERRAAHGRTVYGYDERDPARASAGTTRARRCARQLFPNVCSI